MTKADGNLEALLNAATRAQQELARSEDPPPRDARRPLRLNLSEALQERYRYYNSKLPEQVMRVAKSLTPETRVPLTKTSSPPHLYQPGGIHGFTAGAPLAQLSPSPLSHQGLQSPHPPHIPLFGLSLAQNQHFANQPFAKEGISHGGHQGPSGLSQLHAAHQGQSVHTPSSLSRVHLGVSDHGSQAHSQSTQSTQSAHGQATHGQSHAHGHPGSHLGAARKKVSFSNLHLACSLALISSGELDSELESEEPRRLHPALSHPVPRLRALLILNLPLPTPAQMAAGWRRRPYAPDIGMLKLLDLTLSLAHGLTLLLPEFNKRPLTDTPIVLLLALPVTRVTLDIDDIEEEAPLGKTISHLNLGELRLLSSVLPFTLAPILGPSPAAIDRAKSTGDRPPSLLGLRPGLRPLSRPELRASLTTDLTLLVPQARREDELRTEARAGDIRGGSEPPRVPSIAPRAVSEAEQDAAREAVATLDPLVPTTGPEPSPQPLVDDTSGVSEVPAPQPGVKKVPTLMEQAAAALGTPAPRKIVPLPVEVPKHTPPRSNLEPRAIERITNILLENTEKTRTKKPSYTLNIPGQTSLKTSPDGHIAKVDVGLKLVIVMVGLPARGKLYITNKLTRYLNWLQHDCRVFNVGNTRRKNKPLAGPELTPLPDQHTPGLAHQLPEQEAHSPDKMANGHDEHGDEHPIEHDAKFFDPNNQTLIQIREKWAMDTLDQLLDYVIDGQGLVGIFDATNLTKLRRLRVLKRIRQRSNGELKVLFLELICLDPAIIEANIRLKLSGPDYKDTDPDVALADFEGRLKNYERAYETIDDQEEEMAGFQYVKMINVGKKVVAYNVQGFLASQTVYFLLNFNLCERQIWITRHGELVDNVDGRIGGDLGLTKRGKRFARCLAQFMDHQRREFRKHQLERFSLRLELKYNTIFHPADVEKLAQTVPTEPAFCVWTLMLLRSIETAQYFDESKFSIKEMRMLNELGGGKFEGMTYNEIQKQYPKEFDARLKNKLSYRYPGVGGELYLDVLTRLRPLITEIERTTDHLLIIAHRVVLRILLAYFLNLEKALIGQLDVPLHTLYCLELKPYGTDYRMYEYDEGIDWFVPVTPEHKKNVAEVGVQFKERKYSVVPTAPPTRAQPPPSKVAFSLRQSLSMNDRLPRERG